MANARGGNYNGPGNQGGHVAQFPAYAAGGGGGGQYYGMGQQMGQQAQQQQQLLNYQQYYGAMASQQSLGFGGPMQHQAYPLQPQQAVPRMGAPSQAPVPPPPPPPPGEILSNKTVPAAKVPTPTSSSVSLPPLLPPPLPPMFPWMSAALAKSMTSSRFGKPFAEQVSNLPFVPIIVNDSDLAKMTENVIKEVESTKTQQLQYYKDVLSQDLPQALKDMFQPLYCKLCILTLSSPVVAKDHYNGKRHKKAIETWFLKHPQVTQKKSGALLNPSVGGNAPINGYITKQQNPNPPNRNANGVAAPPPPSLAQSAQRPINNASQSQQQGPQPLIPGLMSRQQNFDMKRPAAAPPPPSITNAQQKPSSIAEKLLMLSSISSNTPNIVGKIDDSPKGDAGMTNTSNSTKSYQAQFKQQQPTPGPTWQKKSSSSNNLNSSDFQQQPAKKPRWETASVPVAPPKQQPSPSPQPQQKNTVGSEIAATATTTTPTPTPPPPPIQQKSETKAATIPPPQQRNSNDRPPPGAKGLCRICNVHLSSPIQAEQHFKGKNHAARVTALKEQGETDLPPPILPPPPQPKPQVPETDSIGPGPMNNRSFGNQPQFNDMAGPQRGGRGDGSGGPRQPPPNNNNNNNRNNNFNNQRHNNNNNNNRFNKNNRNNGPRF